MSSSPPSATVGASRRVLVAGATGYIGRHAVRELVGRGHEVVCLSRRRDGADLAGAEVRVGDVTDPSSIARDAFRGEAFDAVISCLASRSGRPDDAWRIDHQAHVDMLSAAQQAGVRQFVLLSAICVQKPRLAFQQAKLAFEEELVASSLTHSIVRPTAFFKSLSGQVARVKRGKPFVVFGDGELTACTPISERDLARYLADCLDDPAKQNAILPIGGPGEPLTPRAQGELLFELVGRAPRFRHVPVGVLDAAIAALDLGGRLVSRLRDKAELARIGRYYATESMLVWDGSRERYDAEATPTFGRETLRDHYARMLREGAKDELGDHAVFGD